MAQTTVVAEFMDCLQDAESRHDANRLAELFSEDAELSNLTRPTRRMTTYNTRHSANKSEQPETMSSCTPQTFWSQYLHAFEFVNSHFTEVTDTGNRAILEWHSVGQLPMGLHIDYCGVSILEYEGNKIKKFRTYYDSAAFIMHPTTNGKLFSQTAGIPRITNGATS